MKLSQRLTLLASSVSGIAAAGAMIVFASVGDPDTPPPSHFKPTLPPERQAAAVPEPRERIGTLRFAAVPPDIGILTLPPDGETSFWRPRHDRGFEVAAHTKTWAIEIKENVVVRAESQGPITTSPSRRSRKDGRRRKRRYTLRQRLAEVSPGAKKRIAKKFKAAKFASPPAKIAFIAIKDEKILELYARPKKGKWKFIHRYRVQAASGKSGPKLRRGDRQVPEGIYRITYLNPNSRYHVSLRVNYPNSFDRKMAAKDGRRRLGGDIMIHGKKSSAGCLSMGDNAAEELFVLAAQVGLSNIKVIIAPTDFRRTKPKSHSKQPVWLPGLYKEISSAMSDFKRPPPPSLLSLLGL